MIGEFSVTSDESWRIKNRNNRAPEIDGEGEDDGAEKLHERREESEIFVRARLHPSGCGAARPANTLSRLALRASRAAA